MTKSFSGALRTLTGSLTTSVAPPIFSSKWVEVM